MHATKKLMIVGIITFLFVGMLAVEASAAMRGAGGSGGGGGSGSGGGGGSLAGSGGRGSSGGFRTITPKTTPEAVTLFTYEFVSLMYNGKYPLKIGLISTDKADFTVGAVTETLYINKPVVYDLNKDGKGDVSFTLLKTGHNMVTLEMVLVVSASLPPVVPSGISEPAAPVTGYAAAAPVAGADGNGVSAEVGPSDFVAVTKDATSVGGLSVSNKVISAVLLIVAGLVIFKFWRRQRAPQQ